MATQVNQVEVMAQKVDEQITELPNQIDAVILREVASDSAVGAALREKIGDTLKQYLGSLSPDQLPQRKEMGNCG